MVLRSVVKKGCVKQRRVRPGLCFSGSLPLRKFRFTGTSIPACWDGSGDGCLNWRRTIGAALMISGFAAIVGMAVTAIFVTSNYLAWESYEDALRTVAALTAPPAGAGLVLLLIGRWVYGEWLDRAPIMGASSLAVRIAGFCVAIGLGVLLVFLMFTGATADDQAAMALLGLGLTIGVALIFLGFRIKPRSNRRYLD